MTNNDIVRRVRYIFDFNDKKMIGIFAHGGAELSRAEMSDLLKRDDDDAFSPCDDALLARFLNGLIVEKRGKREGAQPEPEKRLTNNLIFLKLKIALNLQADDVLEVLDLAGLRVSKHELSAFFRKPGNKNYRECKDQILRNFLTGMLRKYREDADSDAELD